MKRMLMSSKWRRKGSKKEKDFWARGREFELTTKTN